MSQGEATCYHEGERTSFPSMNTCTPIKNALFPSFLAASTNGHLFILSILSAWDRSSVNLSLWFLRYSEVLASRQIRSRVDLLTKRMITGLGLKSCSFSFPSRCTTSMSSLKDTLESGATEMDADDFMLDVFLRMFRNSVQTEVPSPLVAFSIVKPLLKFVYFGAVQVRCRFTAFHVCFQYVYFFKHKFNWFLKGLNAHSVAGNHFFRDRLHFP